MSKRTMLSCLGVVVAVSLALSSAAQGASVLKVVDLGTLGGTSSRAYGVNAEGDVVGSYVTTDGNTHAFLWHDANGNQKVSAGEMVDLGTLGGTMAAAYSINDEGDVTGWSYKTGKTNQVAFIWHNPNFETSWATQPGYMMSLGTLGGPVSRGYSINNAGVVTGLSQDVNGTNWAFRWVDGNSNWSYDAGETTNLGALGGTQSRAYGINTAGNVVGYASDASNNQQAMKWTGSMASLGTSSTPAYAWAINDSGEIAGYFTTGGNDHAFYKDASGVHDINAALGGTWSEAFCISANGEVGGSYETAGGQTHAFVYSIEDGTVLDLNSQLPQGSDIVLESTRGIESLVSGGMGVGYGTVDGVEHAFIVYDTETEDATPEPMTLMLVGSGVLALWGVRSRREM